MPFKKWIAQSDGTLSKVFIATLDVDVINNTPAGTTAVDDTPGVTFAATWSPGTGGGSGHYNLP